MFLWLLHERSDELLLVTSEASDGDGQESKNNINLVMYFRHNQLNLAKSIVLIYLLWYNGFKEAVRNVRF